MKLRSRHRRTLVSVFEDPVRSDIPWMDIERLLSALGAEITEGRGSRVRIHLDGMKAVFHRPHTGRQANKGTARGVRRFLVEANISPTE